MSSLIYGSGGMQGGGMKGGMNGGMQGGGMDKPGL